MLHAIKKDQVKIGVNQDTAQEFCKRGKLTKSIGKNFPKELVRQGVNRGLNHTQAGRIQTMLLDGPRRKGNFLPRPVEKLMGQCLHPYARPSRLYQPRELKKRQVGQVGQGLPQIPLQQGRWPPSLSTLLTNFRGLPPPPLPAGSPATAATEDSSAFLPFFFSRPAPRTDTDPLPPLSIALD